MTQRERLNDGVLLSEGDCSFRFARLRPGVLLVTVSGYDKGELGSAPLDELGAEAGRFKPLRLFIDARQATGVTSTVREEWTAWFQSNRSDLQGVTILVSSVFMQTVVEVAKLFSRTGELLKINSSPQSFETAIARDVPGFTLSS